MVEKIAAILFMTIIAIICTKLLSLIIQRQGK